jgi:hypothetical protein
MYYFVSKLNYLFVHLTIGKERSIWGTIAPQVMLKLYFNTESSQKLCMYEQKTRYLPEVETLLFYF